MLATPRGGPEDPVETKAEVPAEVKREKATRKKGYKRLARTEQRRFARCLQRRLPQLPAPLCGLIAEYAIGFSMEAALAPDMHWVRLNKQLDVGRWLRDASDRPTLVRIATHLACVDRCLDPVHGGHGQTDGGGPHTACCRGLWQIAAFGRNPPPPDIVWNAREPLCDATLLARELWRNPDHAMSACFRCRGIYKHPVMGRILAILFPD